MNICDLKRGERAIVLKVELEEELKSRLAALRIYAGAKIVVLKMSRKTCLVQAGNGRVAMERGVAQGVRVWRT